VSERSERDPGITFPFDSSAGFSRRKRFVRALDLLRPFRAWKNYWTLIQGWRDLRSLTPGYCLQPLRDWSRSATQRLS
jgi:hypothetical protein